jgi:cobalt-zinc-cadmium efflux system outer membrane protein
MSMSSSLLKIWLLLLSVFLLAASYGKDDPMLTSLIEEALKNSPEIQASHARIEAARQRIPQAGSLPDPQFSFGYQNESFDRYTYGEMSGSQWMFSASQQFYFPGKRKLKEEMVRFDAESLTAMHELLKLKTVARVKELYYDLFLAYKNIDLISGKRKLFVRIEDLTLARYSAGKAMQQDVLMAQTEKYMLLEKEEMLKQKILSLEAMLRAAIGRNKGQMERPNEPKYRPYPLEIEMAIDLAMKNSPEIMSRNKMIEAADTRLKMARKEYFPDFTIGGGYYNRSGDFKDMWAATVTFNLPLYFYSKQRPATLEAKANITQAKQELEAVKLMIGAALRDNYSMIRLSEKLMAIYKNGLIPKNSQSIEQALTGYSTGKTEAVNIISRVKTLLDYEASYWSQFVEREKAISRLNAITAGLTAGDEKK